MLMIEPRPPSSMPGRKARIMWNIAVTIEVEGEFPGAVVAVDDGARMHIARAVEQDIEAPDLGRPPSAIASGESPSSTRVVQPVSVLSASH